MRRRDEIGRAPSPPRFRAICSMMPGGRVTIPAGCVCIDYIGLAVEMNPGVGNAVNAGHAVDSRELRLAVTMNGGVSLAVYMGGVTLELNRLTIEDGPYAGLLDFLGHPSVPVVDVLTGTSAGGINAAALALAQANAKPTDLGALKKLWVQHGQIGSLLRQPFRSGPPSILQGDDYFLPTIESALQGLTRDYARSDRSVDLTITTTLLNPVTETTTDDLGTRILQTQHAGLFQFRGNTSNQEIRALLDDKAPDPVDAFSDDGDDGIENVRRTVRALALAARASASFPVAFEASFIPVRDTDAAEDMAQFADWARNVPDHTLSRFTVDGGVLANTPTRPALDAIRRRVAGERLTRRVLLLIHPHAVRADTVRQTTDEHDDPPSLLATMSGVMRASSSVGSRSYVDEIERHNDLAHRWRDGHLLTLSNFRSRNELRDYLAQHEKPTASWELFQSMRVRRAAFVLAYQIRRKCCSPFGDLMRIAQEVVAAHMEASKQADRTPRLPFVPDKPPCSDNTREGTWQWGLDMAVGVATLATELLRELHTGPELDSPDRESTSLDALAELLNQTRTAWRQSTNARIALEMLGEKEVKAARSSDSDSSEVSEVRNPREWLTDNLTKYADRMQSADPNSAAAATRSIVATEVVSPLWKVIKEIEKLRSQPGQDLPSVTLTGDNPLLEATSEQDLLELLMTVEVIGYLITEQDGAGTNIPSAPIELVQISAQVYQHFAEDFTSDDKLAGMSLNHFGAFLKRSWRANDWIWGRLDGIKTLLLITLNPRVVKALRHRFSEDDDELLKQLCTATFRRSADGADPAIDTDAVSAFIDSVRTLSTLRDNAKAELENLGREDCGEPLEALASLVAYGYQIAAAGEEVPWLAETVYDDQADGAAGLKSAAFLTRYTQFREDTVEATRRSGTQLLSDDYRLLRLFVDSALGQETVGEELPSDMLIHTAATAAAVTATVLSAPNSGLSVAKPVTKIIRGAVGAPYWILTGLTQRGQSARLLAASALALGIGLVALALLAPLGGFISTLVPTVGVGCLITVFAYAAARSRSVVHGAALLGLLIPLGAFAFHRLTASGAVSTSSAADPHFYFSLQESAFGTVLVVILIAGTVVIANINSPTSSPLAAAGDLARRLSPRSDGHPGPGAEVRVRQGLMYLRRGVLAVAAILLVMWALIVLLGKQHWLHPSDRWRRLLPFDIPNIPHGSILLFAAPMLVIVGHGVVMGWRKAHKLRPYDRDSKDSVHRGRRPLSDPAGLAIAWSAVYGALYVLLAVGIVVAHGMKPSQWPAAAAALSLVLGWAFSVVAVYGVFWLRERHVVRRLAAAYASAREPAPTEVASPKSQKDAVALLDKIGEESAYLIKNESTLTLRGRELAARALAKSHVLQLSGRTSRPVPAPQAPSSPEASGGAPQQQADSSSAQQ
jgi:patatin-related protein